MTDALSGDKPIPDEEVIARARRKVLRGIADASTGRHVTVPASAGTWQPFLDGVECKVLHEAPGVLSYLLRLQPGAVLPAHRHAGDEECVVLQGDLRIGSALVIGPGDYHLARAGVLHAEIRTDGGALIFLRGPAPDASSCL